MDLPDAFNELKAALDLFRVGFGAAKDVGELLPDSKEKEAATKKLEEAIKATQVADATIAQALGYELCRGEYPPTPMLKVGHRTGAGAELRHAVDVYECPKCKQNTAEPFMFERKVGEKP